MKNVIPKLSFVINKVFFFCFFAQPYLTDVLSRTLKYPTVHQKCVFLECSCSCMLWVFGFLFVFKVEVIQSKQLTHVIPPPPLW